MTLNQRSNAFIKLGLFINRHFNNQWQANETKFHTDLNKLIEIAFSYNGWFTPDNVERALKGIASMLAESELTEFSKSVNDTTSNKVVAVIMAGNIPAVGFHDMLCVLLSGKNILIKVSSDDPAFMPFLAGMLIYFEKEFAPKINFSDSKLSNFDAVIATGSNNTAKHFEFYFGKYPNIIRKNRSSVAILNGNETTEDLKQLGNDIFYYYGLGCRSVSKLFVPQNYKFDFLFESLFEFKHVLNNNKYNNNYEYNRAIYLLDLIPFLDNNFLMIRENEEMHAPTSVLFYEQYINQTTIVDKIKANADKLQCVVSNFEIPNLNTIKFGKTQQPSIFDFADNVNTITFLNSIN